MTLAKLLAPLMPFLADEMYRNLVLSAYPDAPTSVHLADFPVADESAIDQPLSAAVRLAMKLSSLGRAARSAAAIKVRQPLPVVLVKLASPLEKEALAGVTPQLLEELNVKDVQEVDGVEGLDAQDYAISADGGYAVAVPRTIPPELLAEGLAREIVHRLQTMRKSAGFEIADRIAVYYTGDEYVDSVMAGYADYIQRETLATELVGGEPPEEAYNEDFKLEGHPVRLGVRAFSIFCRLQG